MFLRIATFVTRPRNLIAIAACTLASAMVVAAVTPIVDPDVWWVASAGREILARRAVPRENLFSFVEPSHPWIMHEWLFGPPYARGLEWFGPAVFNAIALAVLGMAAALLALGTIGRARHASVGLLMLLGAIVLFGGRFLLARPTGVALLFPIALSLVAFAPRFTRASAVVAAGIELVWANAHGSFPMGVALLLVAAADRSEDRPLRLLAALGASVATLVNPYGFALHRFVWRYFRGNEGVYRLINLHIKEFGTFAGAWGDTVGPVDLFALILFGVLAVSAARDPRYRVRALFCLSLLALAVLHARHLELAGLLSTLLLLPYVDDLADRAPLIASQPISLRRSAIAAFVLAPACALGVVAFAVSHHRRTPEEWIGAGPAFLRSLSTIPDGARAFVPFPTASLAIWYGFPRGIRVFFDSRNDCYSAATFAAFWSLEEAGTSPQVLRSALAAAGADAAIVPARHPLARFLEQEPTWSLSRRDGDWRAFRLTP
jgi:hypothetical protein